MILTKETLSAGPKIGTGEGVAHSKRWYVALVRMHHEKKVAERLDKMGSAHQQQGGYHYGLRNVDTCRFGFIV